MRAVGASCPKRETGSELRVTSSKPYAAPAGTVTSGSPRRPSIRILWLHFRHGKRTTRPRTFSSEILYLAWQLSHSNLMGFFTCGQAHSAAPFPACHRPDRSANWHASSIRTQNFTCQRARNIGVQYHRKPGPAGSHRCDATSADPLHRTRSGSWRCTGKRSSHGPFP